MESINLNYSVDISEANTENGDFIIQGTAINATTTDNGHRFLVEELRPAAKGMTGIPLLVDHDNLVANIKGRVLAGIFNEAEEKIDFKAKVMDKLTIEMIKDKRINSVSIGANVKEIEENDDGTVTARGIKIKELSLVAIPADDDATFAIALSEAYKKTKENSKVMKGGLSEEMEENDNEETTEEETKEETKEETTESDDEGKKLDEKIKALEIKAKKKKLAKLLEADVDEEESTEETKEETKEEETKEETTEEETKEESEEEEEEKTEESSKLDIVEGSGSLRGHSFSYNW